ncbi:hypothetical protein OC834_007468 [Tilletia horrida]|nr:hypothetical protein OC834_007468 [Tilletia horrida]
MPVSSQVSAASRRPGSSSSRPQDSASQSPFGLRRDSSPSRPLLGQAGMTHELVQRMYDSVQTVQSQTARLTQAYERLEDRLAQQEVINQRAASTRRRDVPSEPVSNPDEGPTRPPQPHTHLYSDLHAAFRDLYAEYSGATARQVRVWELDVPEDEDDWPMRLVHTEDGERERHIPMPRLDFSKTWMSPYNQGQIKTIITLMLTYRVEYRVPAGMTRTKLIRLLSSTFRSWKAAYDRSQAENSEELKAETDRRARIATRKGTTRLRRHGLAGNNRFERYADGTFLQITQSNSARLRARDDDVRADVTFATQRDAQSPELTDMEETSNGNFRKVFRPLFLLWRSWELVKYLRKLEADRAREPSHPRRDCIAHEEPRPGFRLPPEIRRWMVSSEFQQAYPEMCEDVSDNAGPFDGSEVEVVAKAPKDWGSPIPNQYRPFSARTSRLAGMTARRRAASNTNSSAQGASSSAAVLHELGGGGLAGGFAADGYDGNGWGDNGESGLYEAEDEDTVLQEDEEESSSEDEDDFDGDF